MAQIALLTSNDPNSGGIAIIFDNNLARQATWESPTPIVDTLELAKTCVAQVLDSLMKSPSSPEVEAAIRNTNWVSAVAGVQHQVKAWNERLQAVDNSH